MNGNVERATPTKGLVVRDTTKITYCPLLDRSRAAPRQLQGSFLTPLAPIVPGGLPNEVGVGMKENLFGTKYQTREGQRGGEEGKEAKSSPTTRIYRVGNPK